MDILILDSAYKHGITEESIYSCLFNNLDFDSILQELYKAEDEGRTRPATKKESMEVRLAALALLVKNMQSEMHDIVQNERELVHA